MKINNFEYSLGNKKIGPDTLIFNMSSATDCPSKKKGLCKHAHKCYAKRPEGFRPQCLPYRRRQEQYWLNTPIDTIIDDFVATLSKHKKVKYIRFSESGDFHDQANFEKMKTLAKAVAFIMRGRDITFYGYTARKDLDLGNRPSNLVMQGSSFMIDNNFSPYHEEYDVLCKGKCSECDYCKVSKGLKIKVEMH